MAQEFTPIEGKAEKCEKTLQLLITCLKHSSNGKVDWNAIIEELDIVTVNAAKKRFKRMMEPYGIGEKSLTAFEKKSKVAAARGRKKKGDVVVLDENEDEDENGDVEEKRGKKRKLVIESVESSSEDTVVVAADGV